MKAFEDGRSNVSQKICRRSGTVILVKSHCMTAPVVRGLGSGISWRLRNWGEEGGALVEMAMVLPILLLMVTGIFSFGITLNNYLELTDAVSIGARYLALQAGQTLDPCATAVTKIELAAPFLKPANLSFAFVLNGVSYSGTSCSSSSYTTGAAGNLMSAQPAQVTVTYPCSLAVYGRNLAPSCTIVAQTTEIVQ
jgi:Flp pilus assembly protein TadG